MASIGNLQSSVRDLAALEKKLWDAFRRAERMYTPPTLRLVAAFRCAWDLRKRGLLSATRFYPLYATLAFLFAIAAPLSGYLWLLLPYLFFLAWAFYALHGYATAIDKTKDANYVSHGFGVSNLALLVLGVMEVARATDVSFRKEQLAAIIKLVKSSQDHGEVSWGLADMIKRTLWSGLFGVLVFLVANAATVSTYVDKLARATTRSLGLLALIVAVSLTLVYCLYDLVFAQVNEKRRKKKYLLMLNIIHEGWK
ncbi:MAG TPA: hypothetical protein VF169_11060 [Albitalea sp.]|uniref:hypothetical protein n=1 Tax=Piscinibacter sp. TaxID=1903157 RepID=UPI002ED27A2B